MRTENRTCTEDEITRQTYYRSQKEYGGPKVDQPKRLKDTGVENAKLKQVVGGLLRAERGRGAAGHTRQNHELSERRACRLMKKCHGTRHYVPIQRVEEDAKKQKTGNKLRFNDSYHVQRGPEPADHV